MARPTPSAVLFVSNVAKLADFYQRLAGMAVLQAEKDHAVLEIAGFQLVIHAMRGPAPTEPIEPREDSYIKLCFPVASIATAREFVTQNGGSLHPAKKEWSARGFRACDGHDPEGNVIQVREAATD